MNLIQLADESQAQYEANQLQITQLFVHNVPEKVREWADVVVVHESFYFILDGWNIGEKSRRIMFPSLEMVKVFLATKWGVRPTQIFYADEL